MNKDEILAKSRSENKGKDLYENEIQVEASVFSGIVVLVLATSFFIIQSLANREFDFGLYAVVFSFGATNFIVKAIKVRKKRDIILAIIYTIATFIFAVMHLYPLIITWMGF